MEDFLTTLRTVTSPVHKSLEQSAVSKAIMSADLTVQGYTEYLLKSLAIHKTIEHDVFPKVNHLVPGIESRRKTPALLSDLAVYTPEADLPFSFTDNGYNSSLPFNMGMLYVSEGSTLGGMYILRNVQAVLGQQAVNATGFLNVYGQHTGSKWKQFLEVLGNYQSAISASESEEIIAGALYAFRRTAFIFNETIALTSR